MGEYAKGACGRSISRHQYQGIHRIHIYKVIGQTGEVELTFKLVALKVILMHEKYFFLNIQCVFTIFLKQQICFYWKYCKYIISPNYSPMQKKVNKKMGKAMQLPSKDFLNCALGKGVASTVAPTS